MIKDSPKKKVTLPIIEHVDPEERFSYGVTPENENKVTDMKNENSGPVRSETGIVGKTGHLIGVLGSELISSATGAVSLGASAVYTGVSVGTSVVAGALSYIPFHRFRSTAQADNNAKSAESDEENATPLASKKSGILSRLPLFKAPSKDKTD